MEILSTSHHCLYFKHKSQRYLFGLTYSLLEDPPSMFKLNETKVILPSYPYVPSLSIFVWEFNILFQLQIHTLVVNDSSVRQRVEELLKRETQDLSQYKWEYLKQCDLSEEALLKFLIQRSTLSPLYYEPKGLGFNGTSHQISLIIPQNTRTIIMIHGWNIFLVDPGEAIQKSFSFYGLPLGALKGVMLTKSHNLNFLECLMKLPQIWLVTESTIYKKVLQRTEGCLLWNRKMIGSRLKGKILTSQRKQHNLFGLEFSYVRSNSGAITFWDIIFKGKTIRIYSDKLEHFPLQLTSFPSLSLLIVYDMQQSTKKELQECPQVYRKLILFNRISRKYNNKYFHTLSSINQVITIVGSSSSQRGPPMHQTDIFKHQDPNAPLSSIMLSHQQKLNTDKRVGYVISGYARDPKGGLKYPGSVIVDESWVSGEGRAFLLYQSMAQKYFYCQQNVCEGEIISISSSVLSRIRENSWVASLKTTFTPTDKSSQGSYEEDSQWGVLSTIATIKTFQAGSEEANLRRNMYIVVKGSMKVKSSETVAGKGMMISSIRSYYSRAYDQEEAEVVKDTWAVEVPLQAAHSQFFSRYPQRMYELFTKPVIFS